MSACALTVIVIVLKKKRLRVRLALYSDSRFLEGSPSYQLFSEVVRKAV